MKTKITLKTKLKKGDKLENTGNAYTVLEVVGDIYFLSHSFKFGFLGEVTTIAELVFKGYELLTPEWSAEESLKEHKKYWFISILESEVKIDWCFWSDDAADLFRLKMGLIVENEEAGRAKIKEIMEK